MTDFKPKARRPRGFVDRRGRTLAREREIVEKVLGVYEAWGFERLETSAFEYADALGKFLPDQDRPNEGVFALTDDDEQWMALRYDLTAPLARFVAENYDALPKPYRRCAAGPVWRNEKPGPGRFREFWQCDADTVGAASPAADAEMIAMACAAIRSATDGQFGFTIRVNTRKLLDSVLEDIGLPTSDPRRLIVLRAIDKIDRLKAEGVSALLGEGRKDESGDFTRGAGLDSASINKVIGFISPSLSSREQTLSGLKEFVGGDLGQAGLAELSAINEGLDAMGVGAEVTFDTSVVRGLEYYTGAVFEAELMLVGDDSVSYGSVGGGGRYDDLVSRFKGTPIPATGFSVGVSRLAAALTAQEDALASDGPVVVLPFDAAGMGQCMQIAAELRAAFAQRGIKRGAEVYLGGAKQKAQLKYADKRGAPAAVIVGGDELANNTVSIKNLRLGAELAAKAEDREAWTKARDEVQVTAPRSECVARVLAILAAN